MVGGGWLAGRPLGPLQCAAPDSQEHDLPGYSSLDLHTKGSLAEGCKQRGASTAPLLRPDCESKACTAAQAGARAGASAPCRGKGCASRRSSPPAASAPPPGSCPAAPSCAWWRRKRQTAASRCRPRLAAVVCTRAFSIVVCTGVQMMVVVAGCGHPPKHQVAPGSAVRGTRRQTTGRGQELASPTHAARRRRRMATPADCRVAKVGAPLAKPARLPRVAQPLPALPTSPASHLHHPY